MSGVYRDDNCLEHMIEACRKIRRIAAVSRADMDIIWDSAQTDIPKLLLELESIKPGV